jgi:hypothetical protein
VLCRSAFSLAPPLRSTGSAAAKAALFTRFLTTRAGPTSPSHSSSATASGLPDNVPATTGGDSDGLFPVPVQMASAHARVFDHAGSACVLRHLPCCLLWDGKHQHPELILRRSIPRLRPPPVNASRPPSRASRASLGAGAVRYSFTVTDFHRLPFAGLPAHPSTASAAVNPRLL